MAASFDVLPELLDAEDQDWIYYQETQRQAIEKLRASAEGDVPQAPTRLLQNLSSLQGEELEQFVAKTLQSAVHRAFMVNWIVVEDDFTLATGQAAIIFLDAGRFVRSTRVDLGEVHQTDGGWADGCWDELVEWEEGKLGDTKTGDLSLESMRRA